VATKDAESTAKGTPYQKKFTDDWGNTHIRDVDQPDILSRFFESSSTIDKHNQCHQVELALEKCWQTQNPFFRLHTTIIGMNVVDCYFLADHHQIINHQMPDKEFKMTIINFASYLSHQLICNVDSLLSLYSPTPQELSLFWLMVIVLLFLFPFSILTPESTSTLTGGDKVILSLRVLTDANQQEHHQISHERTTGRKVKKRTKTRPCVLCLSREKKRHSVGFGCYSYGISLCCPNAANADQDCFYSMSDPFVGGQIEIQKQTDIGFLLFAGTFWCIK
jgi:hypothetical protein